MNRALFDGIHSSALEKLISNLTRSIPTAVTGVTESLSAFLSCAISKETGKRILLICPNDLKASKLGEDLHQLIGSKGSTLIGGELQLARGASSHESAWRRLETLNNLNETQVLCASMDALMQRMGDPAQFIKAVLRLKEGDRMQPSELISHLIRSGYERVEMVEGKGQCALRGSILDVYPPESSEALRLEFFDDEVDSIRSFDCISQRSAERLKHCSIGPACETLLPADEWTAAAGRMREALSRAMPGKAASTSLFSDLPPLPEDDEDAFDTQILPHLQKKAEAARRKNEAENRIGYLMQDADLAESGKPFKRIRVWLPVLTDHVTLLTDWFHADAVILVEPDQLRERNSERLNGYAEELASAMERGEAVAEQKNLLASWEELLSALAGKSLITWNEILRSQGGLNVSDAVDFGCRGVAGYQNRLKELAADIRRWNQDGMQIRILSGGVSRGKRLADNLKELGCVAVYHDQLPQGSEDGFCTVLPFSFSTGFLWAEARIVLITDADIFGSAYRKASSRRNAGEKLSSFTDVKKGDYVVHEDHGIGVFEGIVCLQNDGANHDYLLIRYAGSDKLYVPVEQLSRVQKYIGNPNDLPRLNSLGGTDWQRQKGKVRAGLKKMAFDLAALYAQRSSNTGYAFSPDTPWQKEFEDQFPYELTADQVQSIREITEDMESDRNMDRLLCGDVGYGKTEVSLRAAFKAISCNKQVAMLAPTTILAQQHYNTAVKRFSGFPVRIGMLSRFRSPAEQKKLLNQAASGDIDFLIGTHRLLAKDVKFKDLGLLIVDEEQRFGVAHKEIIKNMKKQVDVLTLSATPIPRTLHMSMVGIRDMSILETPPEDRLPVQTHVIEYSDSAIRDAILRELSRGGQVYFLYNKVQSIDKFYNRLRQLVPEARIGVAHGQMKEHALEDVMMDFYQGSYDVLLCTTIIESGLDIATANTLIVFDADRFGLSQLYQLRGRVGRSSRQAYAYFTVRPDRAISETAQQRLSAIREFTEFGSGFRIALRDLEIRGAGNVLGPEQHGHLSAVGYDMYCKLLEEALQEVRGTASVSQPLETRIDLKVSAFLPDTYVRDDQQRMEMYKQIGHVITREQRMDMEEELIDRYGDIPQPVEVLLDVAQLRGLSNRLGVSQAVHRNGRLLLRVDARYAPDPAALIPALAAADKRLSISRIAGADAITLSAPELTTQEILRQGVKVMETVCDRLAPTATAQ